MEFTAIGATILAAFLPRCQSLASLAVANSKLMKGGKEYRPDQSLTEFPEQINPSGVVQLIAALRAVPSLSAVDISGNQLGIMAVPLDFQDSFPKFGRKPDHKRPGNMPGQKGWETGIQSQGDRQGDQTFRPPGGSVQFTPPPDAIPDALVSLAKTIKTGLTLSFLNMRGNNITAAWASQLAEICRGTVIDLEVEAKVPVPISHERYDLLLLRAPPVVAAAGVSGDLGVGGGCVQSAIVWKIPVRGPDSLADGPADIKLFSKEEVLQPGGFTWFGHARTGAATFFVNCKNAKDDFREDQELKAKFHIDIINHLDPTNTFKFDGTFKFTKQVASRGRKSIIPFERLISASEGFVQDGHITVSMWVEHLVLDGTPVVDGNRAGAADAAVAGIMATLAPLRCEQTERSLAAALRPGPRLPLAPERAICSEEAAIPFAAASPPVSEEDIGSLVVRGVVVCCVSQSCQ
jgi:hypothetical protein